MSKLELTQKETEYFPRDMMGTCTLFFWGYK